MNVLQALYNSEINFAISTFWDGGFEVKLGDIYNGFKAATNVRTWAEVEKWLDEEARKHFPKSLYATSGVD